MIQRPGYTGDRRVQAVYDALDALTPKDAIHLCDRLLKKKHGSTQLLLTLKAVANAHLGRFKEALDICNEVLSQAPTEIAILQHLAEVYTALGKIELVNEAYADAVKARPLEEDIQVQYYMAMAKANQFQKQQLAAARLHRKFKKPKYMMWSIISLILQARKDADLGRTVCLPLAQKMMLKARSEGQLQRPDDMMVLVKLYMAQGQWLDALESLIEIKSPLQHETRAVKWEIYRKAGLWRQMLEESQETLLKVSPDEWPSVLAYLDAANQEKVPRRVLEAFINEWSEKGKWDETREHLGVYAGRFTARAPELAKLELYNRILTKRFWLQEDVSQDMVRAILRYFDQHAATPSCIDGIMSHLQSLQGAHAMELRHELDLRKNMWSERLKTLVDSEGCALNESPQDVIQSWCNILKLTYFASQLEDSSSGGSRSTYVYETVDMKSRAMADVLSILRLYQASLSFGKSLEVKQRQYGDDAIIVALHILLDAFHRSGNVFYAYSSLQMLEWALTRSKHNFQFKLYAIKLWIMLGVFSRAEELFSSMDVKHIQTDTLSYLLLEHGNQLGYFGDTGNLCNAVGEIYLSNNRETSDMIESALQLSSYERVDDFIEFQNRLKFSISRLIREVESYRAEFLGRGDISSLTKRLRSKIYMTIDAAPDSDLWEQASDQRDRSVMANLKPVGAVKLVDILDEWAGPYRLDDLKAYTAVFRCLFQKSCDSGVLREVAADLRKVDLESLKCSVRPSVEAFLEMIDLLSDAAHSRDKCNLLKHKILDAVSDAVSFNQEPVTAARLSHTTSAFETLILSSLLLSQHKKSLRHKTEVLREVEDFLAECAAQMSTRLSTIEAIVVPSIQHLRESCIVDDAQLSESIQRTLRSAYASSLAEFVALSKRVERMTGR